MSQSKEKEQEGGVYETIKVIAQALLLALVVRTLLFQPFFYSFGLHERHFADR